MGLAEVECAALVLALCTLPLATASAWNSSDSNTSGLNNLSYGTSDPPFSLDLMKTYQYFQPEIVWLDKYVTLFIYAIGFPGNIISFIIWLQKRMRHSSGIYLAALALDDFVFLSLHVVLELHMVWREELLNTVVICQLFPMIFLTAQYLGPILVLGFTTERYISICHPFRREKYCTVRRAKIVVAFLVCLSLCLSGVQGYFYDLKTNSTQSDCSVRDMVSEGGNTSLMIMWNLSIEILTFLLVPLAVLVLNVLVIVELRRMSKMEHHTLHGHSQRTSATTVMLLTVSFYLIITTLPVTIVYSLFFHYEIDIYSYKSYPEMEADPKFFPYIKYVLVQTSIKEFGATQYAFNIIIYVITGKIFRKELKNLFLKIICAKFTLSIPTDYSSLRSSIRGNGVGTQSMWVSVNGHEEEKVKNSEETHV